jgi:hypothetical protein
MKVHQLIQLIKDSIPFFKNPKEMPTLMELCSRNIIDRKCRISTFSELERELTNILPHSLVEHLRQTYLNRNISQITSKNLYWHVTEKFDSF